MSLMGVDIGTTGVKAVVFDLSGRRLSLAYREYPLIHPSPGFAELDSSQVLRAAFDVIAESAECVKTIGPVQSIAVSSQGEAFTPIARDGTPLANGMVSSDRRATDLVTPITEAIGLDTLYHLTGHTPYAMYSLFKFAWLRTHRPDLCDSAWRFLFYEDLLIHALTGRAATDYSLASRSMMFDIHRNAWSTSILDTIGLSVDKLPEALPSGTIVGTVRTSLASSLSLSSKTAVVTGGHDQPCGALGCGAIAANTAGYAIGTVECLCPTFAQMTLAPQLLAGNLATYPHVLPNRYTTVAFNITGGSALRWLRDTLATDEVRLAKMQQKDPYDVIIDAADDRPASVLFVPHLAPTGTPHFDALGTGLLFGLQLDTTRPKIIRAILEGITYEMKWNLALLADVGLHFDELRAVGGGAKSARWMQIKADILNTPIAVTSETEATAKGAALLAGAAIAAFDLNDAALRWATPERRFEPHPQLAPYYNERFELYQQLYRNLAGPRRLWHDLHDAPSTSASSLNASAQISTSSAETVQAV